MTILNSQGFLVAYYFLTFIFIEAGCAIALQHWRRSLALKARHLAIAFGNLGLLRLFFLYIWLKVFETPLAVEYILGVISAGVLLWGFSAYLNNRPGLGLTIVLFNTILPLGFMLLNLTENPQIFLVWQSILILLLLMNLFYQFTANQLLTILGILLLGIGSVTELIFAGNPTVNANGAFIRVSEILAYPILAFAVYQEVIESLNLQSQALKNLSESSQEQIQGLISLFEATKNIVSSLDLSQVLDGAAKSIVQTLNVDQCAIALPEEGEPTRLRMVASYTPHREGKVEAISFPISDQQAIKHALERKRQIEINTADNNPQLKLLFAMMGARDKLGPLILQPLSFRNEPMGVLIVGNAYSKQPFGALEGQFIKTMANQIVNAIENARAHQALITKSQQLAWTLRNNEQNAGRRRAAMEAELKKSREEVSIISQRLYEQEILTRKGQKELTTHQQQTNHLSEQLKGALNTLQKLTDENRQLSNVTESQKQRLETLRQTEAELKSLRNQIQEMELTISECERLNQSLEAAQERSRKLAKALRVSRTKIQQLTSMPATLTNPQASKELENLSCGVLISDAQGKISRVNMATAQLFKVEQADLVGKDLTEIASDESWHKALQKISYETDMLISTSLMVQDNFIKATISPFTDPNSNEVSGNVIILYDASEELESQQARDEFLASLAQEVRTPMTSINGYIELLLGESVGIIGEMQRNFLQRVKANIERMGSLLDDLINIAAIDAGQLELNLIHLNLVDVIEDAIISAKAQLEEKEIELKLTLPDQTPPIKADLASMQHVLNNLLANATKSTSSGGLIEVKAVIVNGDDNRVADLKRNPEERWLTVSVKDSGGGIAEKDIDHVFERFYQADRPLIQGLGETGVGLSIVKYLVEAHGGKVWFETEMGTGTTFYFVLPISDYFNDPWDEIDVPPLDLES